MALVLSMKQGEQVEIGDQTYEVDDLTQGSFLLRSGTDAWVCTQDRAMEVAEDVMISAGFDDDRPHARVVIEAPKDIPIKRVVK